MEDLIEKTTQLIEEEKEEKYFYLDCFEYYFRGWTCGSYWNGWSCPRFTKDVAIEILKLTQTTYTIVNDTIIYKLDGEEEEETLEPNVDGTYSLGAWSWCWSELSEEELKEKIWESYKGDIIEWGD